MRTTELDKEIAAMRARLGLPPEGKDVVDISDWVNDTEKRLCALKQSLNSKVGFMFWFFFYIVLLVMFLRDGKRQDDKIQQLREQVSQLQKLSLQPSTPPAS